MQTRLVATQNFTLNRETKSDENTMRGFEKGWNLFAVDFAFSLPDTGSPGASVRARPKPANLHPPATDPRYLLGHTNHCYSSDVVFFYSRGRKGTLNKDFILSRILFK